MFNYVEEKQITCPYCGERIQILVDCSIESQDYIEDCQVCCRPINVTVIVNQEGEVQLKALHENE